MLKKQAKIIFVGLILFATKLSAQKLLDEVTITANKTEQKLSQTGKVLTVISDSILQKYQGQTIAELLARQAGITIAGSNSSLGTTQELYLRGAGTGNTLILIDGVPTYDPSFINNGFDLNMLNVCECDRIEILKGSQSSLYGSDAVAGVINIFTKKGNFNKPISGLVSLNAGSYGTLRNTLNLNGLTGKINYNLQFTNLKSKGFSAAYNQKKSVSSARPTEFENDGFNQNSFLGNVGINISETLTFRLKGLANKYITDIDGGPFTDEKDYTSSNKLWLIGTGVDLKTKNGKLVFNYSIGENNRIYLDDSSYVAPKAFNNYSKAIYGGITKFADLYWSNAFSKTFEIVFGADYRIANFEQSYLSFSQFGKYEDDPIEGKDIKADILSIYATGLYKNNNFFVEIGGRFNKHSIYGTNFTYSFNPSYILGKNIKAFANISTGFKAPSLYQIYSPYGNKSLKPETTNSSEIGFQYFTKNKNSNLRLVYFTRKQADVIFFQSLNDFPFGKYINFDKQNDNGIELEGNGKIGKLNFWGNYTFVDGEITTEIAGKSTTFNNLFRRPKHQINAGVGYQINSKIFLSTSLKSVGKRTDRFYNSEKFDTENVDLDAYSTIDLYADYKFSKRIKGYIDLKNLGNVTYFDSYGYGTKLFNFMCGVSFGF